MDPALQELMIGEGAENVEAVLKLRDPQIIPDLVNVVAKFGDIVTCRLKRKDIYSVWSDQATTCFKASRLLEYNEELFSAEVSADTAIRISDLRRPDDIVETGKNTIVAIVDWGCDFLHPHFLNPDGSTRLLALWNQREDADESTAQPYGYGHIYSRTDINKALASENPYDSLHYHPALGDPTNTGAHGTHVMDIAAGNGCSDGALKGIAPEADLLFVHLSAGKLSGLANLGDSVRILEALDFIRNIAGDKPWVVNVSLGRHAGNHRGLSLVEQGMDALLLEAPGRAIIQSCGNYRQANAHTADRLLPGRESQFSWLTEKSDRTPNELEIWYSGKDRFGLKIVGPSIDETYNVGLGQHKPIIFAAKEVGHIYHRQNDSTTGDNHVDIFLRPGAPEGEWKIVLSGEDIVDGRYDAWVERDAMCRHCQSTLLRTDAVTEGTLGTICTGFQTVAVGAYNGHTVEREIGRFSSAGPTRDGRQKPNLVAPGIEILAARSAPKSTKPVSSLVRKTGTSMAAPHVTGTTALLFQKMKRPLTIQETRSILLGNTEAADYMDVTGFRVGSGYLNIRQVVDSIDAPSATANETNLLPTVSSDSTGVSFSTMRSHPRRDSTMKQQDVLNRVLSNEIQLTAPSTENIFDAFVATKPSEIGKKVLQTLTPSIYPGESVIDRLNANDVIINRHPSGAERAEAMILLTGELIDRTDLHNHGLSTSDQTPGLYAHIAQEGENPIEASDNYASFIAPSSGRLGENKMIVRFSDSIDSRLEWHEDAHSAEQACACVAEGVEAEQDNWWDLGVDIESINESAPSELRSLLNYHRISYATFAPHEGGYFNALTEHLRIHGTIGNTDILTRNNFQEAIKDFQRSKGMNDDGLPGEDTLWTMQHNWATNRKLKIKRVDADIVTGSGGYNRFWLREDVVDSYNALRTAVMNSGGVITSAGSLRGLSATVTAGRSSTSMHYSGLALDLATDTGMRNLTQDRYVITREGRQWRVWCKSSSAPTVSLDAVLWHNGSTRIEQTSLRAFDFTQLATQLGFSRIGHRRSFPDNYLSSEWWHFQYNNALVPYFSQFGIELLSLDRYSESFLRQRTSVWKNRKRIFKRLRHGWY